MNLECNKILASVVLGCLVLALVSTVVDAVYEPEGSNKRGYQVEVSLKDASAGDEKKALTVAQLMVAADLERGRKVARRCSSCHSFEKEGKNRVGPDLWGIVGSSKASNGGYNYSSALKSKGGDWDYKEMFAFLHNPRGYVPGTKMTFAGIRNPEQLADLLLYMNSRSDNPLPLPGDGREE